MNPKFIIFLDIDGVFNCQTFFDERIKKKDKIEKDEHYSSMLCSKRIGWFNELVKEIDAQVVISSTWRHNKDLQQILNNSGATFEILDITPTTRERVRGVEIKKWLQDNIKPETHGCHSFDFYRYAIIDDDSDMLLNQQNHFFQTDNYSGLTPNTCYRIKRFALHKTF